MMAASLMREPWLALLPSLVSRLLTHCWRARCACVIARILSGASGLGLAGVALNVGIAKNSVESNWLGRPEIALMESERAA